MKLRIPSLPSLLPLALAALLIPAHAQTFVPAPTPGSTNSSSTQPPPPPPGDQQGDPKARMEEHLHRELKHLTEALGLTDEQRTEIAAILHQEGEEMHGLFQNQDLSNDDKKAQFKAIREKSHAAIAALLNPAQLEIFQQMPEHRPGGPGGSDGNGPKPAPAS